MATLADVRGLVTTYGGSYHRFENSGGLGDETSDGTPVFTNVNSATQVSGAKDYGLKTVAASNQRLTSSDAMYKADSDFTWCGWAQIANVGAGNNAMVGKLDNLGAGEYVIFAASNSILLRAYETGATFTNAQTSFGSITNNTLFFWAAGYVLSTKEIWASVNNGTPVTNTLVGTLPTSTLGVAFGAFDAANAFGLDADFDILDEVLFVKYDLRTDPGSGTYLAPIYNSGTPVNVYESTGNRRRRVICGAA